MFILFFFISYSRRRAIGIKLQDRRAIRNQSDACSHRTTNPTFQFIIITNTSSNYHPLIISTSQPLPPPPTAVTTTTSRQRWSTLDKFSSAVVLLPHQCTPLLISLKIATPIIIFQLPIENYSPTWWKSC